jgi:uncharacterized protein YbjT (DUF2867 family)
MARILVVGGTGTAGRSVVAEALHRGHEVTVASRRVPALGSDARQGTARYEHVDILTSVGFDRAFEGQDALIDTTNGMTRSARLVLTVGAQNLLQAAARFSVKRAVLLSIVGVRDSTLPYYQAKAEQERHYLDSALDVRVVAATQFHDLMNTFFRSARGIGLIPVFSGVRFQPIATTDVARALVDAAGHRGADGSDAQSRTTIGGPDVATAGELAATYKRVTGARSALIRVRLPGAMGAAWRAGENLVPQNTFGTVTYEQWLADSRPPAR